MRNYSQVAGAAEAKPPKDAARLGAAARAQADRRRSRLVCRLNAAAAFPGFESRAFFVRSPAGSRPLAPPGSEAGKGLARAVDRRL